MKKILFATDGSQQSQAALELAADIAVRHGAKLVILTVTDRRPLDPGTRRMVEVEFGTELKPETAAASELRGVTLGGMPGFTEPPPSEQEARARLLLGSDILVHAEADAKKRGATDVATDIVEGDPAAEILAAVARHQADMIVMGSRGLSNVKSILLGSVSHKVASDAQVRVVTVTSHHPNA